MSNYPPEHLRRSQPALGHLDYNQQPYNQPVNGDGNKTSTLVPTGGRYTRTVRPPMDGRAAPVRSKSVPDFDEMDYGVATRVRPAGSTMPGRNQGRDSMFQQRMPGEDQKQAVVYPSTREVYSGGNYPPVRLGPSVQGPRPLSASGGSSTGSNTKRQYGRVGRPANPAAVQAGSMQPVRTFSPSRQASGYGPPDRSQPVNGGQPRTYQFEEPGRDPRTAPGKGSTLTRYPNFSGLNTIGLNDWQEPHTAQNRTVNMNAHPYLSQVSTAHPSPSMQGPHSSFMPQRYQGPSIRHEQPLYHGQRTQLQEDAAPPIPPPPSDIYASVSKATAISNHKPSYVGPGPADMRKNYPDQRWNPSQPSEDPRLRQTLDRKEPEYAQVRPRANPTSLSQPLAVQSSVVSPWVREEQELEAKRREDDKRRLRAQEMFQLSQRPNLTKEEMEKLKRLMLEAEFDRRLEEVSNQDDQDDDTDITPAVSNLKCCAITVQFYAICMLSLG